MFSDCNGTHQFAAYLNSELSQIVDYSTWSENCHLMSRRSRALREYLKGGKSSWVLREYLKGGHAAQ